MITKPPFIVTAENNVYSTGMTLRDYFAGQALVGFISARASTESMRAMVCARNAYDFADAMLAERENTQ